MCDVTPCCLVVLVTEIMLCRGQSSANSPPCGRPNRKIVDWLQVVSASPPSRHSYRMVVCEVEAVFHVFACSMRIRCVDFLGRNPAVSIIYIEALADSIGLPVIY